jgi:Sec-independent protein translocase protein TatA
MLPSIGMPQLLVLFVIAMILFGVFSLRPR